MEFYTHLSDYMNLLSITFYFSQLEHYTLSHYFPSNPSFKSIKYFHFLEIFFLI